MIGAGIWVVAIAFAGYYFEQAVESVLGDIKHYEIELIAGIVGLSALVWVIHFYRHRINKSV